MPARNHSTTGSTTSTASSVRMMRWNRRLSLSALVLFAFAVAGTAQGHEMLYDQNGYRLALAFEAGLDGFAVGNVDAPG